jgi:MraZ protein
LGLELNADKVVKYCRKVGFSMFTGASLLALDAKGRIAVPTRHREAMMAQGSGQLVVTRSQDGACLVLYPMAAWEPVAEQLRHVGEQDLKLKRMLIGHAQPGEMDATGRVLIAPELRDAAGIGTEIKLLGMADYFELWEPARLDAKEALEQARSHSATASKPRKEVLF